MNSDSPVFVTVVRVTRRPSGDSTISTVASRPAAESVSTTMTLRTSGRSTRHRMNDGSMVCEARCPESPGVPLQPSLARGKRLRRAGLSIELGGIATVWAAARAASCVESRSPRSTPQCTNEGTPAPRASSTRLVPGERR